MQITGSSGSLAQILAQMQQKVEDNLKAADADGNGKLSKAEFAQADAANKGVAASHEQTSLSNAVFTKLDKDGDGFLTLEEIEAKQSVSSLSSSSLSSLLAFSQSNATLDYASFLDGDMDVGGLLDGSASSAADSSSSANFVQAMVARYAEGGYGTEEDTGGSAAVQA